MLTYRPPLKIGIKVGIAATPQIIIENDDFLPKILGKVENVQSSKGHKGPLGSQCYLVLFLINKCLSIDHP